MSTPSSSAVPRVMRPGGIGIKPMMLCTVTDLPQPDSPTIASVFARAHAEARAAHGLDDAAVGVELDVQIRDLENRRSLTRLRLRAHSRPRMRTSSASRKPSPSRLNASTVMLMNSAGNSSSCGCDEHRPDAFVAHAAPRRRRRRDAHADERQERLGEDRRSGPRTSASRGSRRACSASCAGTRDSRSWRPSSRDAAM